MAINPPVWLQPGRPLLRLQYALLVFLGTIGTVYHLWFAYTFGVDMQLHLVFHLALMMVVVTVIRFDPYTTLEDGWKKAIDNYLVLPTEAIAGVGVALYMWDNYRRLTEFALGIYTTADVVVGALLILLIIDLSRRAFGMILPLVGIVGLVYALAGPYFPSILRHSGVQPRRLITSQTVEFVGVYDTLLQVAATFIVIFIIFAGVLEAFGAMNYFIRIGAKVGSYVRSGVTQTAVITSIGMGSVNGSAAANAATTGLFTIPLMKNQGLDKDTAGAIEAVASSGGQVMPPIMGAAAFIMADITGTSYLHIVTIGLIPALLFYGTVAIAVHMITLKEGAGIKVLRDEATTDEPEVESDTEIGEPETDSSVSDIASGAEPPGLDDIALGTSSRPDDLSAVHEAGEETLVRTLLSGLYLWVPVAVLIVTLVVLRYSPLYAGFWTVISVFPVALFQSLLLRDDYKQVFRDFGENTLEGFRIGIQNTAPITLAVAVIAVFVGVLGLTGFTQALAQSLINLSGGVLFLLLFFAMITAILFGLGMPTVAAYIVAVLLVAPALVNLGIRLETAHFFVFYFAILSAITPPVAITCIITTEITKGNFWNICKKALAIGLPLFIVPYVFVVNDVVMYWSFPETLLLTPALFLGFVCLSAASINYFSGPITLPVRVGMVLIGIGIMFAPILPAGGAVVRWLLVVMGVMLLAVLSLNKFQPYRKYFSPEPAGDRPQTDD